MDLLDRFWRYKWWFRYWPYDLWESKKKLWKNPSRNGFLNQKRVTLPTACLLYTFLKLVNHKHYFSMQNFRFCLPMNCFVSFSSECHDFVCSFENCLIQRHKFSFLWNQTFPFSLNKIVLDIVWTKGKKIKTNNRKSIMTSVMKCIIGKFQIKS